VAIVAKACWTNPVEIKRQFGRTVDFIGDNRVIFDLGGNKRIDPETVSWRKK
jgi:mRNA interferase HigB